MARRNKQRYTQLVVGVFGVAFLLVAIAVGYKVVQEGSVLGLSNVHSDRVLYSWEFKIGTENWRGRNLGSSLKSVGGYLNFTTGPSQNPSSIRNDKDNPKLSQGPKALQVRMSIKPSVNVVVDPVMIKREAIAQPREVSGPIASMTSDISSVPVSNVVQRSTSGFKSIPCMLFGDNEKWCPPPLPKPSVAPSCKERPTCLDALPYCRLVEPVDGWCPPPKPQPKPSQPVPVVSVPVSYWLAGKKVAPRTLILTASADGAQHEYSVSLPETEALTLGGMEMTFEGVSDKSAVSIDWIRFKGNYVSPLTPTPTVSCVPMPAGCNVNGVVCDPKPGQRFCPITPTPTICKYGVNSFTAYDSCGSELYRHAKYSCYGAIQGVLGTGDECLSSSSWSVQAKEACYKSSNCDITPTPTPTPLVCKTGLNSFSVDTSCGGYSYRYMTFSCYDGYGRREGGSTSCKPSDVWSSYAKEYCAGHSSCNKTPTPNPGNGNVACIQDAKICPDGSGVGRIPPSCEFAPCSVIKKK